MGTDFKNNKRYFKLKKLCKLKEGSCFEEIDMIYKGYKYYISIKYRNNNKGFRWYFRNKWQFEIVWNCKNYAPFVLFSTYEDCILNIMLVENSLTLKMDEIIKTRIGGN